jgi:hypothetical protein
VCTGKISKKKPTGVETHGTDPQCKVPRFTLGRKPGYSLLGLLCE